MGMYGWIEGTPVEEVRDADVAQALHFVEKLYQLRKVKSGKLTESCRSLPQFRRSAEPDYTEGKRLLFRLLMPRLRKFLDQDFRPFMPKLHY